MFPSSRRASRRVNHGVRYGTVHAGGGPSPDGRSGVKTALRPRQWPGLKIGRHEAGLDVRAEEPSVHRQFPACKHRNLDAEGKQKAVQRLPQPMKPIVPGGSGTTRFSR